VRFLTCAYRGKSFSELPLFSEKRWLLKINIHPPKALIIKEVIWCPLLTRWLKVNTDGALTKNPTKVVFGVIFRDSNNVCHCCSAHNLNTESTFIGEISRVMKAIKNWNNLWLETDSRLVLLAFRADHMVPWSLRNIWFNCLQSVKNMNFLVSHIYIEGNMCIYVN